MSPGSLPLRRPSLRATAIVGGAVAVVFGSVATTDTLAGDSDSANAKVSQIASENFYPAPVVTSINCERTTDLKARLTWPNMGSQYKYRVDSYRNNSSFIRSDEVTGTSYTWEAKIYGPQTLDRLRVHTINTGDGSVSTGYRSYLVKNETRSTSVCDTGFGPENVTNWQESALWTPKAPEEVSDESGADEPAPNSSMETDSLTSESGKPTDPSTSESEKPAAPSTSESETPEPSAPETSEPATTEPSKPEADEPTGDVKLALRLSGDTKQAGMVVDGESSPRCAVTIDKNAKAAISGKTMLITEPDGSVDSYKAVLDPATKSCAEA